MLTKYRMILSLLPLLAALILAACSPSAGAQGLPAATPTDCGCSAEGPNRLKATDAFGAPAGPGVPAAKTPAPGTGAGWETFTSQEAGFSFEYPAGYAGEKYAACAARPNANPPAGAQFGVSLGSRTELSIAQAPADLDAALDAFRADPARKDFTFDAPRDRTVGGVPARVLSYRSGGTGRYAESTFFIKDGLLYRVDTGTPSACDLPGLSELDAYTHLLDTFQFH